MNNQEYINALRRQRELARKIERFRYARGYVENNNTRNRLNRKIRTLIAATAPLEEQLHILGIGVPENKKRQLKKQSYVVSMQNMARRGLKKRQNAHAQRTAARRSSVVGAHHTIPRRYIPTFSMRRPITKKRRVTRSVTSLTRYLSSS
jgi:hypothetical protein